MMMIILISTHNKPIHLVYLPSGSWNDSPHWSMLFIFFLVLFVVLYKFGECFICKTC